MKKDIENYEGLYSVTSDGVLISNAKKWVRGFKKETLIKPKVNKYSYLQAVLQSNKKTKTVLIHRLVALSFIPNIENKIEVNHINGIKTDNRVENLEWVTSSENLKHAYKKGLKTQYAGKNPNARKVINIITNEVFDCINDARLKTKYSYNYFYSMLNGTYLNKTDYEFHK
jgi:hypothetical protein